MNKTKRKRVNKEAIWAYVFILLPLCTFTVFTIYPVVSSIVTSFQDYKPLGSEWVGFGNYVSTFKNNLFYKALKNTAVLYGYHSSDCYFNVIYHFYHDPAFQEKNPVGFQRSILFASDSFRCSTVLCVEMDL